MNNFLEILAQAGESVTSILTKETIMAVLDKGFDLIGGQEYVYRALVDFVNNNVAHVKELLPEGTSLPVQASLELVANVVAVALNESQGAREEVSSLQSRVQSPVKGRSSLK